MGFWGSRRGESPTSDASLVLVVVSRIARPLHGRPVKIRGGEGVGLLLRVTPSSIVWISGRVEEPVQTALRRVLRSGDVFFDVGASVGFFTLLGARLVGPRGTVVAFEPHPATVQELRQNVDANALDNVLVLPQAVSSRRGDAVLELRHGARSSLADAPVATGRVAHVATTSIDDFVAIHPVLVPAVVKIDVEGHEVDVLRGMRGTLSQHNPFIICEMHGKNEAFSRMLTEVGYSAEVVGCDARLEDAPPWAHVVAAPKHLC